ncbi:MAG: DUF4013 domain-containing protein [Methanobrevibacter sp.]|nr:DUF4013 domain-containing protein [Methanobrevibacter sp.]
MKFRSQIYDALKYTLRDWKPIILLGLILYILSVMNNVNEVETIIGIAVLILTIALLFLEEGYRYQIIKETIKGNNNPPSFENLKKLIIEGFLESFTISVYLTATYIFIFSANKIELISHVQYIHWFILVIISMAIYFLSFGAVINKALHDDKFISAFNLIEIGRLYLKIGLKRTILLIIIGTVSINFIITSVIELGIYDFAQYLDFIINFIVNPILILFLTRLSGLIGKEVTYG